MILARLELPAAQSGVPMTCMHDGRQFVVMSVGDAEEKIAARLVALALPRPEPPP